MVLIPRRARLARRLSRRVGTSRAAAARLLEAALVAVLLAAGAVAAVVVAIVVQGWTWWVVAASLLAATVTVGVVAATRLRRARRRRGARRRASAIPAPDEAVITVVIPAYCEQERLGDALESLALQTFPYWRAIVIDDQSPDDTAAVAVAVAERDPRVQAVRLRRNSGLPAARNAGLSLVTTPYVQFLDGDDTLFPDALADRLAKLEADPAAAGAYGKIRQVPVDVDWRAESTRRGRTATTRRITVVTAAGENPFGIHEVLLRTTTARQLGGFDESLQGGGEDVDFWARSLRSGHEYVATGRVDCLYRQTPESMVSAAPLSHMDAVIGLLDGGWAGQACKGEVAHSSALDGDLGPILRRGIIESRLLRYLGMATFAGNEVAIERVVGDLTAAAPLVTSRAAASQPIAIGASRSAKRLVSELNADDRVVSAVTSALGSIEHLFEAPDPVPLEREDHPSWAVLADSQAHVAGILGALDGVPPERRPVFLLSDSVDADQGALAYLTCHAPAATWRSIPKFALEGVAYDRVLVPRPVSWVGRLVADQARGRGSDVHELVLPSSDLVAVVDEETTAAGLNELDPPGDRVDLAELSGLAAAGRTAAQRRVPWTADVAPYPGLVGRSGAMGDYRGLSRPSIERLMELKDSRRGERCVIIGNGPSLNHTDLDLLKGVPTFGVNGIYYADARLPEPLTYYVVEDTKVFEENTADVLAYGRGVGTMLLPTLYEPACGPEDDPVFFRMNGGFYRTNGPDSCRPRFSTNAAEVLYCGQSVTIINLQLAYWMGFAEVAMIGMDFSYAIPPGTKVAGDLFTSAGADPNHFDSRYFGAGKTWKDPKLHRVRSNYELAKTIYAADGRRILNATVGGELEVFDRVALADFTAG